MVYIPNDFRFDTHNVFVERVADGLLVKPVTQQRRYRLKFADTYYGELNHYGMYWLKWGDVRRRRN